MEKQKILTKVYKTESKKHNYINFTILFKCLTAIYCKIYIKSGYVVAHSLSLSFSLKIPTKRTSNSNSNSNSYFLLFSVRDGKWGGIVNGKWNGLVAELVIFYIFKVFLHFKSFAETPIDKETYWDLNKG